MSPVVRMFELACLALCLLGQPVSAGAEAGGKTKLPERFQATETSRLMGSPDPWPLETVRAFPKLTFERPVEVTSPPGESGRNFVLEQKGRVLVFEDRDDVEEAKVFLDLRDVVRSTGNEEGLLGLAFHPKYRETGEFFVYYSTTPRASVIARYRVSKDDPNRADRDSEERLLVIPQPYENHNGGSIRFGGDGFLYIGLGDGGLRDDPHGNAQNLSVLLGKILRIDVDRREGERPYAIPKENPFVETEGARGEIWAYGFRNPWRIAFDRQTNELWTADVGQDRFEEVDLVRRGGNYGWNIREGFHDFEPSDPEKELELIDPLVEYFHGDGQSITGGVVYRGERLKEYVGAYFYGDYLSGKVWVVRQFCGRVSENPQVAATSLQIAAFGETADGEMVLCCFDGGLYRMAPAAGDREAIAKAFPKRLSETGLFRSVEKNEPAESLIPYEVNVPFWSDYAVKERFLALPEKGTVRFRESDKWEFPVGTVFVKTFWMHQDRVHMTRPRRLETRLFVHAPQGWVGYTYVYNEEQTEATLLDEGTTRPIEVETAAGTISQPYYFPSRSDCLACHNKAEGFVLGLTTRQMNRTLRCGDESRNQLELLTALEVFKEKPAQPAKEQEAFPEWGFGNWDRSSQHGSSPVPNSPPPEDRDVLARAWLEVNCAVCHRPSGIAPGNRDLRAHVPLETANVVDRKPGQTRRLPSSWRIVAAGEPEKSDLLWRMSLRGERQMPPIGTRMPDERGLEVIADWIRGMPKRSPNAPPRNEAAQ